MLSILRHYIGNAHYPDIHPQNKAALLSAASNSHQEI
jgi:hypothetical protein